MNNSPVFEAAVVAILVASAAEGIIAVALTGAARRCNGRRMLCLSVVGIGLAVIVMVCGLVLADPAACEALLHPA